MESAHPKFSENFILLLPSDEATKGAITALLGPDADSYWRQEIPVVRLDGRLSSVSGWRLDQAQVRQVRASAAAKKLSFRFYGIYKRNSFAVYWKTMWSGGKAKLYKDPDA